MMAAIPDESIKENYDAIMRCFELLLTHGADVNAHNNVSRHYDIKLRVCNIQYDI